MMERAPMSSPFHEGELAVQERAGEREVADRNGAIVQGRIPARAFPFLAEQPMLVVGSADAARQPWASVLFGAPGFVRAEADGEEVRLDLARVGRSPGDALWTNLRAGADLALLAIDLDRRRRLRVNGWLADVAGEHARLAVREAYPNCPKYIQRRRLVSMAGPPTTTAAVETGDVLDAARLRLIETSDTFFVASRHPERGLDVSHRGGLPGFVRAVDHHTLRVPDYPGNGMYNTLGNLLVDQRVGVVFVDFARDRALQLVGTARVRFDDVEQGQPTIGTRRFWELAVAGWREAPTGVACRWQVFEPSPFTPALGDPGSPVSSSGECPRP
jgi:uncharacterized protein